MRMLSRSVRTFLVQDERGSVGAEWTVLTGMLVAMSATFGTIATGINIAADGIEAAVVLPINHEFRNGSASTPPN